MSTNIGALIKPGDSFAFLQNFVAGSLIIVPYLIVGIYLRKRSNNPVKTAFWVSIIPVLFERILIFTIGAYYASQRLLPGWNGLAVIQFIQVKSPAFYFTIPYIILGSVSVLICIWIASLKKIDV